MSLVTIEQVPSFPNDDISDSTASYLEVLLATTPAIEHVHSEAEKANASFRLGHIAIGQTAELMADPWTPEYFGLMHGVISYETIAALVRPTFPVVETGAILLHAANLLNTSRTDNFITSVVYDMRDEFTTHQPKTVEVIKNLAQYHGTPLPADYAFTGAAIARQFDKGTQSFSV